MTRTTFKQCTIPRVTMILVRNAAASVAIVVSVALLVVIVVSVAIVVALAVIVVASADPLGASIQTKDPVPRHFTLQSSKARQALPAARKAASGASRITPALTIS